MKDIFTWKEDSFSVEVTANEISSARSRKLSKKVARYFKDDRYISQIAIGDQTPQQLWQQCENNFTFALPISYEVPPIHKDVFNHSSSKLSPHDFETNISSLLEKFKKDFPNFIVQGKFTLENSQRHYLQESGGEISSQATLVNAYLCLKYRSSANIIDHVIDLAGDTAVNLASITNGHADFLNVWDKETTLTPGKKNVCFLGETSDLLGKLIQSLRPEVFHSGASILSGKAQSKIFHQDLSINDCALDPDNGIFRPFDDEGTVRPKASHPVVTNGVFHGPLYDLRTAHKYNMKTTGNAYRSPIPRGALDVTPNSLDLLPGSKTLTEHFLSHDEVIVILMAGGGDTTADGEFSTPAQVAFLVKDGKVVGRLPQITLRGNIRDYLGKDFIGIAKDRLCSGRQRPLLTRLNVLLN